MTKPNTMDDFNPNDARTWDDKQRAVYEVGHREGESCEGASWTFMLDEAFNIEASDPQEAKALITAKMNEVDRAARMPKVDLNDPKYMLQSIDDPIEKFNMFIYKWCPQYAHLIDTDENDGQEIREMIASLKGGDV